MQKGIMTDTGFNISKIRENLQQEENTSVFDMFKLD